MHSLYLGRIKDFSYFYGTLPHDTFSTFFNFENILNVWSLKMIWTQTQISPPAKVELLKPPIWRAVEFPHAATAQLSVRKTAMWRCYQANW